MSKYSALDKFVALLVLQVGGKFWLVFLFAWTFSLFRQVEPRRLVIVRTATLLPYQQTSVKTKQHR